MPGATCSVPRCGVNRREAFSDIVVFQIPNKKGKFYFMKSGEKTRLVVF